MHITVSPTLHPHPQLLQTLSKKYLIIYGTG